MSPGMETEVLARLTPLVRRIRRRFGQYWPHLAQSGHSELHLVKPPLRSGSFRVGSQINLLN
jgi:hypothetical protein